MIGIGSDVEVTPGDRDRAAVYLTYVESIKRAGAIPVLIPPQPESAADVLEHLDGLLLAGGADCDPAAYEEERHPTVVAPMDARRQGNDLTLARLAREQGIPTLGICLGMQVMNVAAGGSLIQDIGSEVSTTIQHESEPDARVRHGVTVRAESALARILGETELQVNSSHHQAVKRVGAGLSVTASAPDGVVEALEDPAHPFYVGVQWHPEDMSGEGSAGLLFAAFVAACRARGERDDD